MDTEKILRRAVQEIQPGQIINLGIGLPTLLIQYLPDDMDVLVHSENGVLGAWKRAKREAANPELIDAGGGYITTRQGSSFFDSAVSFAIVRRAKLDVSMMGAFEVDEQGNLANSRIPGRFSPGIGGAVELAEKTSRVVILCSHMDKSGNPKIVKDCELPLTARNCVSRIITDKAVMDVTAKGLVLREIANDVELTELLSQTGAELIVSDNVGRF